MSKSENNHDNSDFQMLKEEISESEYQNAQYEAEKKKHMSYWVMIMHIPQNLRIRSEGTERHSALN